MTTLAPGLVEQDIEEGMRLHRLMTAYLSSKAIFSALDLGVFDGLEERPDTVEGLGTRLGLAGRPMRAVLHALVGEDLVRRDERGHHHNSRIASRFLVSSSPTFLGRLAAHQDQHFSKFSRLTDSLRADEAVTAGENYSAAFGGGEDWARRLAGAFRASAILQADRLAAAAPLTGRRHLVDLGCAAGAYSIAIAKANPELRITAVDSGPVAAAAREYVAEAGLSDRVHVRPGDIAADAFPECDTALLSQVLIGWDAKQCEQLLRDVHGWLPEGGELLVHDHFPSLATMPFASQMGLILVVNNTRGGEIHTETEVRGWLERAGFRIVEVKPVTEISGLIRARK